MNPLDPRVTPARGDVAAAQLRGIVDAKRYVEGCPMRVAAPCADLRQEPSGNSGLETQLLYGERFTVYDEREGWALGQADRDLYVGYAPAAAFLPATGDEATHIVSALRTLVFPAADMKSAPVTGLSLGARVAVASEASRFARLKEGGFIPAMHLAEIGSFDPDCARTAERYLGTPYLWGGRTSDGLDCSALVQLACQRAGIEAPRDTDQQEGALGRDLGSDPQEFKRGDLVFWEGHVGLMLDPLRLIHANMFQMAVVIEPLAVARARIQAMGQPIKRVKRIV